MAVEYSYIPTQVVAVDENVLFLNGSRCCKKGLIIHNDNSGIFRIKSGGSGCGRAIYKVHFNANIAIAEGGTGTVEPISVALTQNGEVMGNTISTVTPVTIGALWSISFETFVEVPCGCCDTIAIRNVSDTTDIDVVNANVVIDRVA